MGATFYYEEELFPPGDDGRADKEKEPTKLELMVSNFYSDHQIYLRIHNSKGEYTTLHLTKSQADELADSLTRCKSYIGYDNT